jgi:predicted RNA-binding Zn-ribbon protein involved in translation (DUF1610 family)
MGGRFFCENCGAAVELDAKTCPRCGMSFADVLCQACGFSGPPRLFAAGSCPACGHTAGSISAAPKPGKGNAASPRFPAAAPPVWAYVLALLAFAGIFALLLTK